ncbi:MAG: hypothetical protein ACK5LL_13585 [Suipraeoptans sp.]
MKEELLRIENGNLIRDEHNILKRLFIQIYRGEAVSIVFDDARERKWATRLFAGNVEFNSGVINYLGSKVSVEDAGKLFQNHICIVDRENRLVRSLSIMDNIFLGVKSKHGFFVKKNTYESEREEINEKFGINLLGFRNVEKLSQKERIILEMIKAYVQNKEIIILSDLSNILSDGERTELYKVILKFLECGMSFIIMEPFDHVMIKWTSRLYIVKHGKTMGVFKSDEADINKIYASLLLDNKQMGEKLPRLREESEEEWIPIIEFEDVCTNKLKDFNLSLGKGELVKLYVLDEDTGEQISGILDGSIKKTSGKLMRDNREYSVSSVNEALQNGVGFIEELASENMMLKNMTVFENISLMLAEKIAGFWIRKRYKNNIRDYVAQYIDEELLDMRPNDLDLVTLQKIVYYRWLIFHPKLVVCKRPFGLEDIHIRNVTIELIKMLCEQGIAIIVLTSKFDDLQLLEGENIYLYKGREIDEDEVYQNLYRENDS